MKYNPKSTAIPEIIPVVLICTAGIIYAGRMHPCLPLLSHRDYFRRPDSSLSRAFAPQGLLPPVEFISISLFCSTGIISTSRMHLYLALLLHRDYFHRPNASLSCAFAPQGLFPPVKCISILLFCFTGIILPRPDASLSRSFVPQGLLRPAKSISILLFCSTGIISTSRMHLYLALLSHRDYFAPAGCISILIFCFTGIISTGQMHPQLALLLHRDYLPRPDASLSCSFVPQGLFPPARCISIFLFCSTGIIWAARMHLYLALLFHKDYFGRPNASLSCSFVTQGLFPPAKYISILHFCSTGIISAGRIHLYLALLLHRDYFHRPNASLSCSFEPIARLSAVPFT